MARPNASAVIVTLAVALAVGVRAQQTTSPQRPMFRSSVDLIQVDVAVTDRNGRPVKGLSAADFTLLENGQPKEVAAFAEVSVPAPPTSPAAWLRDVPPDVRSNELSEGRLFAILMDDATMPPDLQIASNARRIGRGIISKMGPGDLAAVIFVTDVRRSVDFTNDRGRLLAAIDGFTPGFAYVSPNPETDSQHYFASIRTLGMVSGLLTHVPQRRKAVIYVSTGVPMEPLTFSKAGVITPAPLSNNALATVTPTGSVVVVDKMDQQTSADLLVALTELIDGRPQEAYGAALEQALIRAQHGNVNIYSIDPSGLGGMESYLSTRNRMTITTTATSTTASNSPIGQIDAAVESRRHRDYLQSVADNSGGHAIVNTNSFDKGVGQIFDENSAYYLLGYQSEPTETKVRTVSVRINKPGLTVRTRNAYNSSSEGELSKKAAAAPDLASRLAATVTDVLPNPGVTMRAASAVFALPDERSGLAVSIGVEQRVLGDVGARVNEELSVLATAFTLDGKPKAWSRQSFRVWLRAGFKEPALYEVLTRLDLDPGRYQVRVAAHSAMTGKTGSVYFDAVVPPFAKETLQLSGLTLSASPSLAVAPGEGFAQLLPVIPTSRRSFVPQDLVTGFLRVYQRAAKTPAPVSIRVTITDGEDRVRQQSTEVMGADQFTGGQADIQVRVPVAELPIGEYLLSVAATQGQKTVRRDMRFAVRPGLAGAPKSGKS